MDRTTTTTGQTGLSPDQLAACQADYLAHLPRMQFLAEQRFRWIRCANERADRVQDVLAMSWQIYLRLFGTDKWSERLISSITYFACKMSARHEGINGRSSRRCVLARCEMGCRAQFATVQESIHDARRAGAKDGEKAIRLNLDSVLDATASRKGVSPAELAILRIDWQVFTGRLTRRQRQIVCLADAGFRSGEIAGKLGILQTTVCHIRQGMRKEWHSWHKDAH
jgi:ATP/maltotriose-dependent transcriptional regulator MalT